MANPTGAPYHQQATLPSLEEKAITEKGDVAQDPSPKDNSSSSSVTANADNNHTTNNIEYVYLSWETEVARKPVFPDGLEKEYPEFPDLSKHDNPFGWSRTRKNLMTYVSCATNGIAAYCSGSYASPEEQLTHLWDISYVKFQVGISVFVFGFAVAPMILAPFSEINGRRPVFVASGLLFVLMQLVCAVTPTYGGIIAARFLAGVGGSTFSTMVGGILADIWVASERNTPMVLFSGATLFGTGLGPLCSGFIAQNLLWRWVFYVQIITSGFLIGLIAICFKETRGPILLARRAKALNRWYEAVEQCGAIGMEIPTDYSTSSSSSPGKTPTPSISRIRYKVLAEEQRASLFKMIKMSLYRPAHMLVTEPILICFTLWISFSWGILYLQFSSIPLVFETNHGFNIQEAGAVFTSVSVGGLISTWLSIYQDKWAARKYGVKFTGTPEGRLWFTCFEALLMPIGMFWFGWTCYSSIHWIVPAIALVAVTMGIFSVFLATFNYQADVYQTYASSAMAAAGVCRNMLAGVFPLVTRQMYTKLGFQAASSLCGGIGLLLSAGPILLIWFGPRMRAKSKIASQFMESNEKSGKR